MQVNVKLNDKFFQENSAMVDLYKIQPNKEYSAELRSDWIGANVQISERTSMFVSPEYYMVMERIEDLQDQLLDEFYEDCIIGYDPAHDDLCENYSCGDCDACCSEENDETKSPLRGEKSFILESPKEAGSKYDDGKPDVSIVPKEAVYAASRAFSFGAKKYARGNFKGGIRYIRLINAVMRHMYAFIDKEEQDPESGLNPLDHAAAALAMLIWMKEHRPDLDDR